MKIKVIFISILLLAFACQNAQKEGKDIKTPKTEDVKKNNVQKVQFDIVGMTCTGCENAIQKTINEFDGVYSSKADHQEGIALIEVDSVKVDLKKIEQAINELGYEAKGYKKLSK
ncbi:MAG: cation transporter [Thiohalospira sp.]